MIPVTSREWRYILSLIICEKKAPDDINLDALEAKAARSMLLQERREALNATYREANATDK